MDQNLKDKNNFLLKITQLENINQSLTTDNADLKSEN